jgi:uncharacterized protein Usg
VTIDWTRRGVTDAKQRPGFPVTDAEQRPGFPMLKKTLNAWEQEIDESVYAV